jgi:hypothetical protein
MWRVVRLVALSFVLVGGCVFKVDRIDFGRPYQIRVFSSPAFEATGMAARTTRLNINIEDPEWGESDLMRVKSASWPLVTSSGTRTPEGFNVVVVVTAYDDLAKAPLGLGRGVLTVTAEGQPLPTVDIFLSPYL